MRLQLGELVGDSAESLARELAQTVGSEFDEIELGHIVEALTAAIPEESTSSSLIHLDPMKVMKGLENSTARAKVSRFCIAARKLYQALHKPTQPVPTTAATSGLTVITPTVTSAPSLPRIVGPWTFTKILLGAGGFGRVYLARQGNKFVAVKQLTSTQEAREEFQAMQGLNHPAIPKPGTLFQAFLAVEFINGDSLKNLAPMPPRSVLVVGERVASALHYLHNLGKCHADIKLANIMVDRHALAIKSPECIKLIDFGLARNVRHDEGTGPFNADIRMLGRVLLQLAFGPDVEPSTPLSGTRWSSIGLRLAQIIKLCLNAGTTANVSAAAVYQQLRSTSDTGGYWDA